MCSPISPNNYFALSPIQVSQFHHFHQLVLDWNSKINLISRKDEVNLTLHHVIHSLAIAKVLNFQNETSILDVGTGGGFPGIPLAILFPHCKFTLIDSTEKKIKAVTDILQQLNLTNTTAISIRAEEEKNKYDFIISRATMTLSNLYKICKKNISKNSFNVLPNGFLTLKGGNINAEIAPFKKIVEIHPITPIFNNPWFNNKYVIYLPA